MGHMATRDDHWIGHRGDSAPSTFRGLSGWLQNQLQGATTGQATSRSLQQLLANPINNELFQAQMGPILKQLEPQEARAREALTDRFRQTGQSGSGAFAVGARQQEGDILANRSGTIANAASRTFNDLLRALSLGLDTERAQLDPLRAGIGLLDQYRTAETADADRSTRAAGGAGGGFGGGGSSADIRRDFNQFSPESQAVMERNLYNPSYPWHAQTNPDGSPVVSGGSQGTATLPAPGRGATLEPTIDWGGNRGFGGGPSGGDIPGIIKYGDMWTNY